MQDHNLFGIYLDILIKHRIKYFVTGSVASIVYGEPRLTHDIDLVIFLKEKQVDKFVFKAIITFHYGLIFTLPIALQLRIDGLKIARLNA